MSLDLVIGGIRSGKSALAERMAADRGEEVIYVAAGSRGDADPELAERIAAHRRRRPPGWRTLECLDPGEALSMTGTGRETVLVEGFSGWVGALMEAEGLWSDQDVEPLGTAGLEARERALGAIRTFACRASEREGSTIVVGEEASLGLVPSAPGGAGTRRYLDLAGEALQALAGRARRVLMVIAGQAVELKGPGLRGGGLPELRVHGDSMAPDGAINFAVNVAASSPTPRLQAALAAGLARAASYPDDRAATAAIGALHARPAEEALALNGSVEGLWLLAAALRGSRCAALHPMFTEGEAAFRAFGHQVARVMRDPVTFALRTGEVPEDAGVVLVCNPNNPTGNLDRASEVLSLARPGRILVVDEAFMPFTGDERESLASRRGVPGLVVLRSLTKAWSLAGIRAGYLLAEAETIEALKAVRPPWAVNALALAAIESCCGEPGAAPSVAGAREELSRALARIPGVSVWPSAANFVLIRAGRGGGAAEALAARSIAVRRCASFPGLSPDHLRIAVRSREENRVLAEALREALA